MAPAGLAAGKKGSAELKNLDNRRLSTVHLTIEINVSLHLSILISIIGHPASGFLQLPGHGV
ncbi:MAG: hypothetical protein KA369_15205 [Spirochaetes bacterium]|nr:hypothetical protein [Spirochaetota bacterium]